MLHHRTFAMKPFLLSAAALLLLGDVTVPPAPPTDAGTLTTVGLLLAGVWVIRSRHQLPARS